MEQAIPVLSVHGMSKHFGHVAALDAVSLDLYAGEVMALLGDNGAGKSTFVSLISGVVTPSSGDIRINGSSIRFDTPAKARTAGIATVFQDLSLVEERSIADNLFLGVELRRFGCFLRHAAMIKDASNILERLKVNLPPVTTAVRHLSGGQRQAVAVARTILRGSRIAIMDEPTAALGVREAGKVLDLIRQLRASGAAILLVSHNMDHVFEVADRAVVFRLGRKVADIGMAQTSRAELVGLVAGSIDATLETFAVHDDLRA